MADISAPKAYGDKVVLLPPHQFPYGADCKLDRSVQAFAFHYGLSQLNVDTLHILQLSSPLAFSTCDPDGDEEQVATCGLILTYFDNPVAVCLITKMIRRLCRKEPFTEVPQPAASVQQTSASGGPPVKKVKSSVASGAVNSGAVPSTSGLVPTAPGAPPVPDASVATPALVAKPAKKSSHDAADTDTESDCSDCSDSALDADATDKPSKPDKAPKDLNLMVEEIGSPVSILIMCFRSVLSSFHAPPPAPQTLRDLWRELLKGCKLRIDCNSDEGDYSGILRDLNKVIVKVKPTKRRADKQVVAKTLLCILKKVYHDVQLHARNGHDGVAAGVIRVQAV